MLRRLPHQSAMDGFEDDEVIRGKRFSRVENTQTEVPSSGGGSTEGTGRERDEGRVQWARSEARGRSTQGYDRDRAAMPRCDTMRVGTNAPEWVKGRCEKGREAAETQTQHTESADAEGAEGIGRGRNGTGPTAPGGVSKGTTWGSTGNAGGREWADTHPETLTPHMAGSCDRAPRGGDGGSGERRSHAADMALERGHPDRGGHAHGAATLPAGGEHQHVCAGGMPPAHGSDRGGLQVRSPTGGGREGRRKSNTTTRYPCPRARQRRS